jgi:lysophospholipase L1-like esterase
MNASTNSTNDRSFAVRVLTKTLLLFVAVNVLVVFVDPMPLIGRLSIYNWLVPGRPRLPFADRPERAYSLTLGNLNALLASHEISAGPKPPDEYRIVVLGDSAAWGYQLKPEETVAGALNAIQLKAPDGRRVRVYNLAYPKGSATKDLLLLNRAMRYQPDMIVWLIAMSTILDGVRYHHQLVKDNPGEMRELASRYQLRMDPRGMADPARRERTLLGRRRAIADVLRLQVYGVLWSATGIDHDFPPYTPVSRDVKADDSFYDMKPRTLTAEYLAFDVIGAANTMAGEAPLLIVNEPILIADGTNSGIRYNDEYPRWIYDQYRALMQSEANRRDWNYLDVWDLIPPDQFTDTEFHITAEANRVLARRIEDAIIEQWKTSQTHSQPTSPRKS